MIKSFKLLLLSLFCLLIQTSCFKKPEAAFSFQPVINPEAGDELDFINESQDAEYFFWDFDNGKTSEEENPSMIFEKPGDFNVSLIAESKFRTDSITQSILINPPTVLDIYCFDSNLDPLNSGWVRVWKTLENAQRDRSPLYSKIADSNGLVTFKNLEATTYYVYVEKNMEGGKYAGGGTVGPLVINKINTYGALLYFQYSRKKSTEKNPVFREDMIFTEGNSEKE